MKDSEILFKYSSLPDKLKKEFETFLEKLSSKSKATEKPMKKRPLGLAKGLIELSPDFDKPLDDFKEYMN